MTPSPGPFGLEVLRKCFHMLSLLYLAAYRWLGVPLVLWLLGAWLAVELSVELARLRLPAFNRFLIGIFGGIHREAEAGRVSGIFWTGLGAWLTFACFGRDPAIPTAAILYLAVGDAAAALAGKRLGRTSLSRWTGTPKTLEGAAACFAVCLLLGGAAGLRGPALWAGAAAATLLELFPPPPDDNFWIPFGSSLTLALVKMVESF